MKIITAVGNPYLNENLKKYDMLEVLGTDIQYYEGIFEFLEENKDIDLIILSNNLPGEKEFIKIISEIIIKKEEIEIIVFLKEKDEYIEAFLNSKNIFKVYYLREKDYKIFLNTFINKKEKMDIKEEIKDFKELILANKKEIKVIENNNKNIQENTSKIIIVSGNFCSGKSLISIILSQYIENRNKKTLLIDFDINNDISTILGIKKENEWELKDLIKCIKKNLYVLCETHYFFKQLDEFNVYKISEFLEQVRQNFDFIIIDISSNIEEKYVEKVLQKADKIIFLLEPNLLEIKKTKQLLDVYLNDFNISYMKIKLLLNKVNKYKISEDIIKEIFSKIEIIGSIKYEEKYTLFINKKFNNYTCENENEKIYEKIIN